MRSSSPPNLLIRAFIRLGKLIGALAAVAAGYGTIYVIFMCTVGVLLLVPFSFDMSTTNILLFCSGIAVATTLLVREPMRRKGWKSLSVATVCFAFAFFLGCFGWRIHPRYEYIRTFKRMSDWENFVYVHGPGYGDDEESLEGLWMVDEDEERSKGLWMLDEMEVRRLEYQIAKIRYKDEPELSGTRRKLSLASWIYGGLVFLIGVFVLLPKGAKKQDEQGSAAIG